VRLYHPAYERKRDRVTGVVFAPRELDGRHVATADVDDPAHVRSLRSRGFLPWPHPVAEAAPAAASATPTPEPSSEAHSEPHSAPGPAPLTAAELDAMTVAELRAIASERGVTVPARATKAAIRALIPPTS
jgi:hypothetical protein